MTTNMNMHETSQTRPPRIGIDIGRVIIAGGSDLGDTSFFGRDQAQAMKTPVIPGAFAAITVLVARFEGRAWLVSKCGDRIRARSMAWLDHHDFWAQTGLPRAQVRFCRERRDKAIHARQLGLTHFVDDRVDVLKHLQGIVEHLYLFGPQPRAQARAGMVHTPGWSDVLAQF